MELNFRCWVWGALWLSLSSLQWRILKKDVYSGSLLWKLSERAKLRYLGNKSGKRKKANKCKGMIELKIYHLATIITDSSKNYQWMQKPAGESLNNKVCRETIQPESLVSPWLQAETPTACVLESLLNDVCIRKSLRRRNSASSWAKIGLSNVQ